MGRKSTTGRPCKDCGKHRDYSNTYRCAARNDGLDTYCKDCRAKRSREFALKNPDIILDATNRYRYNHPEFRDRANELRRATRLAGGEAHERTKLLHRENYKRHKAWYLAQNSRRRKIIKLQTPKWADIRAIVEFYANCPPGYHVDHIVPLRGKSVSGLHVVENLQYLPSVMNLRKGNRFEPGKEACNGVSLT